MSLGFFNVEQDNFTEETLKNFTQDNFICLVELACRCDSYYDVVSILEKMYQFIPDAFLTIGELSYLDSALTKFIEIKRSQIEQLENLYKFSENKAKDFQSEAEHKALLTAIKEEKSNIEKEILNFGTRIIEIFDGSIFKNISQRGKGINREIEIFLFRIKGDIHKYFSQLDSINEKKKIHLLNAKNYYTDAFKLANKYFPINKLSYLQVAVSFVKFLAYYNDEKGEARNIANFLTSKSEIQDLYNSIDSRFWKEAEIVKAIYKIKEELS